VAHPSRVELFLSTALCQVVISRSVSRTGEGCTSVALQVGDDISTWLLPIYAASNSAPTPRGTARGSRAGPLVLSNREVSEASSAKV
jgi:hypothetical protein